MFSSMQPLPLLYFGSIFRCCYSSYLANLLSYGLFMLASEEANERDGGKGKREGVGYSSLFPASPRKRENVRENAKTDAINAR